MISCENFCCRFGNLIFFKDLRPQLSYCSSLQMLTCEELATLSRPRQCCWDATARSDALFMWSGPSPSGPQLSYHTYPDTKCNHDAHTNSHACARTVCICAHRYGMTCTCVNILPDIYGTKETAVDNIRRWYEHTNIGLFVLSSS